MLADFLISEYFLRHEFSKLALFPVKIVKIALYRDFRVFGEIWSFVAISVPPWVRPEISGHIVGTLGQHGSHVQRRNLKFDF